MHPFLQQHRVKLKELSSAEGFSGVTDGKTLSQPWAEVSARQLLGCGAACAGRSCTSPRKPQSLQDGSFALLTRRCGPAAAVAAHSQLDTLLVKADGIKLFLAVPGDAARTNKQPNIVVWEAQN